MTTGPGEGRGRVNVYKPSMATTDILPAESLPVGGGRHVLLLDLIGALESTDDEDLLRMLLHGWTQQQVAAELGIAQSTVSRRFKRLTARTAGHEGPCFGCIRQGFQ